LILAGGTMPNGTPTPPEILGLLFHDEDRQIHDEAVGSILKLSEPDLRQLAADAKSSAELLKFLATHFHESPSIGVSIISNKNITLEILKILQGKGDDVKSMDLDDTISHEEVIEAGYRDVEESYDSSILNSIIEDEDEMTIEIEMGDDGDILLETEPPGRPERDLSEPSSSPPKFAGSEEEIVFEKYDSNGFSDGSETADRLEKTIQDDDVRVTPDEFQTHQGDDIVFEEDRSDERDRFSETLDHVEKKFDDVFDFVPVSGGGGEAEAPKNDMNIVLESRMFDTPLSASDRSAHRKAFEPTVSDGDAEVTLATDKFVTRIPKQRYYYKAGLMEILTPVIKVSLPVIIVLIIFLIYWISVPTEPLTVEPFESGVNRNLIDGKILGFNSKLPNPMPEGAAILSWQYLDAAEEAEFTSGRLRGEMESFLTTYDVEIRIEELKTRIEGGKRELNSTTNRQSEIADRIESLNAEIASLEELLVDESLNEHDIEDERQAELTAFKGDFSELEERYLVLEEEIADVRRRIAAYDGPIGEDESPGHVANKLEFETLTRELEKIAPQYNRYKDEYQGIIEGINRKYDTLLYNVQTLKKLRSELISLQKEQLKNIGYIETIRSQIESYNEELEALENSQERGPALKGVNLSNFLVFNYFLVEKMTSHDEEVPSFERYTIYKRIVSIDITHALPDGEQETSTYVFTFMRMETFNKILVFSWNYDSTTWVLTGIADAG